MTRITAYLALLAILCGPALAETEEVIPGQDQCIDLSSILLAREFINRQVIEFSNTLPRVPPEVLKEVNDLTKKTFSPNGTSEDAKRMVTHPYLHNVSVREEIPRFISYISDSTKGGKIERLSILFKAYTSFIRIKDEYNSIESVKNNDDDESITVLANIGYKLEFMFECTSELR